MVACSWLAPKAFESWQEQAVAQALKEGINWAAFLALVDRHRVPALAYAVLCKFADQALAEPARSALKARSDASRKQALRHSAELLELCKAFAARDIPLIPLKGGVLSQRLYGDPSLRQAKDLDVLVRLEDLDRAESILLDIGWQRKFPSIQLSPRQRAFLLATQPEMEFYRSDRETQVDLHWSIFLGSPKLLADLWRHAATTAWMGSHYLEPEALDLLLFLSNHGAMHAWFRLKWLGDVATFLASGQIQDWRRVADQARDFGMTPMAEQGFLLVHALYGLPLPQELVAAFKHGKGADRAIRTALEAIQGPESPRHGLWSTTKNLLRTWRYLRHLNPRVSIRAQVLPSLFCIADFERFPIPDRFFWAYLPLRPVLWLRRHSGNK